jgi:hypothetical protein
MSGTENAYLQNTVNNMVYKLAVYHQSIPNKKNLEKIQMLQFFAAGAKKNGDTVTNIHNHQTVVADVAVIQGWIAADIKRPHLKLRNDVINQQLAQHKYVITADSNLFLYADTANTLHYLRYSFNGVFPNTGIYCDDIINPKRWQKIQQELNISIKDYRTLGNHILICLQRSGGWSMGKQSVVEWATSVVQKLKQHTDRPIILRAHPGDKQSHVYLKQLKALPITISTNKKLQDDLNGCWAVVNHNSSPAVAAAIEGYPVFVTDPERSQCKEIANVDLAQIESPNLPDRLRWVQRLSMSHWNFNEVNSGEAWAHMRQFVRDIP